MTNPSNTSPLPPPPTPLSPVPKSIAFKLDIAKKLHAYLYTVHNTSYHDQALARYYHNDVEFSHPLVHTHTKKDMKKMFRFMARIFDTMETDINNITWGNNDKLISIDANVKGTLRYCFGTTVKFRITTLFHFGANNLIVKHEDNWSLLEAIEGVFMGLNIWGTSRTIGSYVYGEWLRSALTASIGWYLGDSEETDGKAE